MSDRSKPYTPFWWALKLKQGIYKSKPKRNRCMFCGIKTTKEEQNLCTTCFQIGEQEFKFNNYPKEGR